MTDIQAPSLFPIHPQHGDDRETPEFDGFLRTLTIQRFKGFRAIEILNLARVNLFTGRNNSGKTNLLEAIFLLFGPNNPALTFRLMTFRGIDQFAPFEVWEPLFYGRRYDDGATIEGLTGEKNHIELRLRLSPSQRPRQLSADMKDREGSQFTVAGDVDLVAVFRSSTRKRVISRVFIEGAQPRQKQARLRPLPTAVFLGTHARFFTEDAARFSRLAIEGREQLLVEVLRVLEPRLRRLSVLAAGGRPVIHGDIGLALIPVPLMGEGMARMLSILLAIVSAPGGVVLIDEVERGFHHSVLRDLWQVIDEAAARSSVQVFATTHSWECVKAAHEVFGGAGKSFQLTRIERQEDQTHALSYDSEAFDAAVSAELEVR
jgi:hypothetical protein